MIKDNLYPYIVAQEEGKEEPTNEETVDQEENPIDAPEENETPSEETPSEEKTPSEETPAGDDNISTEGGEEDSGF